MRYNLLYILGYSIDINEMEQNRPKYTHNVPISNIQ